MFEKCVVSLVFLALATFPMRKAPQTDLMLVLKGLLREEDFREVNYNNKVAIGLGSCIDVAVDTFPFFEQLGITPPSQPSHHNVISSQEQLAESFAYSFEFGAAAERYVSSEDLFRHWATSARSINDSSITIGGNAPVMAGRFALEGWHVLLGAQMNPETQQLLHKYIKLSSNASDSTREDVHLLLEYDLGDVWGEYRTPRANRFIVHNDYSNMMMDALDSFVNSLKSFSPALVVIGGLQMLDNFPYDRSLRSEKLQRLSDALVSLPSSTKIHFEMASITEESLMKELLDLIFPYVDSIGMNEQELANLCSFIEHGNVTIATDAYPRVANTLDNTRNLYHLMSKIAKPQKRSLTRIHVHTLAFQAILVSKHSDWKNMHGAVAKASLTANRHVCASNYINLQDAKLIMDESFQVSRSPGSHRMPLIDYSPVSCWSEHHIRICVAPNLVCTNIHQTAGGGDNISAAGLVLQL